MRKKVEIEITRQSVNQGLIPMRTGMGQPPLYQAVLNDPDTAEAVRAYCFAGQPKAQGQIQEITIETTKIKKYIIRMKKETYTRLFNLDETHNCDYLDQILEANKIIIKEFFLQRNGILTRQEWDSHFRHEEFFRLIDKITAQHEKHESYIMHPEDIVVALKNLLEKARNKPKKMVKKIYLRDLQYATEILNTSLTCTPKQILESKAKTAQLKNSSASQSNTFTKADDPVLADTQKSNSSNNPTGKPYSTPLIIGLFEKTDPQKVLVEFSPYGVKVQKEGSFARFTFSLNLNKAVFMSTLRKEGISKPSSSGAEVVSLMDYKTYLANKTLSVDMSDDTLVTYTFPPLSEKLTEVSFVELKLTEEAKLKKEKEIKQNQVWIIQQVCNIANTKFRDELKELNLDQGIKDCFNQYLNGIAAITRYFPDAVGAENLKPGTLRKINELMELVNSDHDFLGKLRKTINRFITDIEEALDILELECETLSEITNSMENLFDSNKSSCSFKL